MNNLRKLITTGLCIAIGIVLPIAFHSIPNAGGIFLPMHIPVLLCGLIAGPWFGLACGVLTPILSSVITGMPPIAMLPSMLCELAVYGLVSGAMNRSLRVNNKLARTYISLVTAMLAGRVLYGLLNALIFKAGEYSISIWLTAAFVTSLPGIAIQLVLIPPAILALSKAKLVGLGHTEKLRHAA